MKAIEYKSSNKMPVFRFWYKGSHRHPVRRTCLVLKTTAKIITAYELREGNEVRLLPKAPIKTYRRDKIAKGKNLRTNHPLRKKKPEKTTLICKSLIDILESGI